MPTKPTRGRGWASALWPAALRPTREALAGRLPVDDAPPGVHVVVAAVLVLQVVGVLPDVDAQQWPAALRQGRILVGRAGDDQLAVGGDQPRPAAAEPLHGVVLELGLERVEAAEVALDGVAERAGRLVAGVRAHDLPEERVVVVAAAVVAHGGAGLFVHRQALEVAEQLPDRPFEQLG